MISAKGRYALLMLLELAQHPQNEYVSLQEVARRQGLSEKYLESVVTELKQAGYIKSRRGREGGFSLNLPAGAIRVADVFLAMKENLYPISRHERGGKADLREESALTRSLWEGLMRVTEEYLRCYTLQDLLEQNEESFCCRVIPAADLRAENKLV